MAESLTVEVVHLPIEAISQSCGFSIDLGGSALKVIYRSKEDFNGGIPLAEPVNNTAPVRLVRFARENIDEMIEYIGHHCDITSNQEGVTKIITTGMGGNVFKEKLETELKVVIENITEFACAHCGIMWLLRTLPEDQVFVPLPPETVALTRKIYEDENTFGIRPEDEDEDGDEDKLSPRFTGENPDNPAFPVLQAMCGSSFLLMKLDDHGPDQVLDVSLFGGLFFLGASRIFTGETVNFDELMDMMTSSDGRSVDVYTSELVSAQSADSYSSFQARDFVMFPFGKAHTAPRDTIKDGDVIHSLVSLMLFNLATICHLVANNHNLKTIYFWGNFLSRDVIRSKLAARIYARNVRSPKEKRVEVKFLRYGGYLPAIGAFFGGDTAPPSTVKATN